MTCCERGYKYVKMIAILHPERAEKILVHRFIVVRNANFLFW